MTPRELAAVAGLGRAHFFAAWSRDREMLARPRAVQDAAGCIFVHIPKTAGMSVCKTVYGTEELLGHAPAHAWQRLDPARFRDLFVFSLMREPADRFVSAFYFLKAGGLTERDKAWGARHLAPYQTPEELLGAMANPLVRGRIMSWLHFIPQHWYLTDRRGRVIVDYIGRVETFDESMAEITRRLGLDRAPARENVSRRPPQVDLGPQARARLDRLYAGDYRLYRALDVRPLS